MKIKFDWPIKFLRGAAPVLTVNSVTLGSKDSLIWADFNESISGINVTEGTALNFSAVWACNKVLAETVASLPLHIYERQGEGSIKAVNHPLYSLLHDTPNNLQTSFSFREQMQSYINLWGNAYAYIQTDKYYQPIGFEILHPSEVLPVVKTQLWYKVKDRKTLINARDMIHIYSMALNNDCWGVSPVLQAKEIIGNGLALQEFSNRFFGSGANMSGILQTDQVLKDDAYKRLKEGFETRYAGIDKAHKTAVLEQGLKYQRIGIEPEAAQFLESRRFSIEEIARWFRIPPHMIGDLSKSSFSNIEQQSIDFVTHSLRPHLVRWEQELNKKLFTTEDRKKYFISFNIEGLLRGDAQARAGLYQVLFNTSSITPNEIRSKENMNPIDGGDDVFVQMNMQKTKDLGNEKEGSKEL